MRWYVLALLLATAAILLLPRMVEADGPCIPRVREVPPESDAWRFEPTARGVGRDLGVPSDLIVRTIHVESGGDPDAVSYAGARGLAQLMPIHWQPGERWWEPYVNIRKAAGLLRSLFERFGDWQLASRWYGGFVGYERLIFECEEE